MTSRQANRTKPVLEIQVFPTQDHSIDSFHILNSLFRETTQRDKKRKYHTSKTCDDSCKLIGIEKRIHDEIIKFQDRESLNKKKTFVTIQIEFFSATWKRASMCSPKLFFHIFYASLGNKHKQGMCRKINPQNNKRFIDRFSNTNKFERPFLVELTVILQSWIIPTHTF